MFNDMNIGGNGSAFIAAVVACAALPAPLPTLPLLSGAVSHGEGWGG